MKKEIIIPTSWEEVTLGEFIKLSTLDINNYESPVEYYIYMLKIFGNDNLEEIFEYIKGADLNNIVSQMSFMNTPPKELDIKQIDVDSVPFKLTQNMNDLTIGEYITIETLIEHGKLDSVSAIPAILSVILRPSGEEFNSDLCDTRMELFKKHLSIEDVLGMSVFFSIGER
jgi:hypothetical protein